MKSARAATVALLFGAVETVHGQPVPMQMAAATARQLADLSLEQLGSVEVTSVSGRAEPLQDAAASVFVISRQDNIRSGATPSAASVHRPPRSLALATIRRTSGPCAPA